MRLLFIIALLTGPVMQAPPNIDAAGNMTVPRDAPFELRPSWDLPDGYRVFSSTWTLKGVNFRLYEKNTVASCAAPPGVYKLSYTAQAAEPFENNGRTGYYEPFVSFTYEWTVTVQGARPPPVDPDNDEPKNPPAPEGVREAVILYESGTAPPLAGEAAAGMLRKEGTPVFFSGASRDATPPAQFANAYSAAWAVGLPALVIRDGGKVTRSLKLPETAQAILDEVGKK